MSNTGVFKKYLKPAVIVLLLIWLGIVLSLTVLGRTPSVGNHFQPDFLWSYKYGYKQGSWFVLQMIENVIMYMPFGFLFPFLLEEKLSGWKLFVITLIAGLAVSFTTESMQYLFKIGLFEFDDLFHNGLGIVIGFLIHLVLFMLGVLQMQSLMVLMNLMIGTTTLGASMVMVLK